MKMLPFYKSRNISSDQAFNYFVSNLRSSIAGWDYYVDWKKVQREASKYTDELNLLNGLIGSSNLKEDFLEKVVKYPQVILTFPTLLAIRHRVIEANDTVEGKLVGKTYDFSDRDSNEMLEPEEYWDFFEKSGLVDLIEHKRIKNLTDYVFGVETGLDSNGRKNRGGHAMENLAETFVKDFCLRKGFKYLKEANASKIKLEFGYVVPVDKSSRRYDFVIDAGKEPILIETNFYSGGGSKLKSTAGEYRNLFDVLENKFKFVWITDGAGWHSSLRPLQETFNHNDYVLNLYMLEHSALDEIV